MQDAPGPRGRWRQLAVLAACVLLALVPWFSAASVAGLIADEWAISPLETALLTVAVQVGFAIGALGLGVMAGALTLPHDGGETLFTVVGVAILALGHRLNRIAAE